MTSPKQPHRDPESLPAGGTGKAAAGLLEGFLRDAFVNGSVLLSLITLVAGFVTKEPLWSAVGVVVGVPGIVMPWLSVKRRWRVSAVWVTVVVVSVADLVAMTLMWTTT